MEGSGTTSEGTITGYSWAQTAGEPKVSFQINNIGASGYNGAISFTAPETVDGTTLEFQLVVTNSAGAKSDPAVVKVTVKPAVKPPVVSAGPDLEVDGLAEVELAGSASAGSAEIAKYSWKQVSGEEVTLKNTETAKAAFTAPSTDKTIELKFELTVTDSNGKSGSDTAIVTVTPENAPKLALTFPPAQGAYLEDRIEVFGRVEAKNGEAIDSITVQAGTLDPVTVESPGDNWRVSSLELPADVEEFEIVVTARDTAGLVRQRSSRLITRDNTVGTGGRLIRSVAMALDTQAEVAYLLGEVRAAGIGLIPVDLRTGARGESVTNFTDETLGPVTTAFKAILLDREHNRVLLSVAENTPYAAVIAVDLQSGKRSVISDAGVGTGEAFSVPVGLALGAEGVLYLADNNKDMGLEHRGAIFRVDTATGDRQVVANAETSSWPIVYPLHTAWNPETEELLVTENLTDMAPVAAVNVDDGQSRVVTANDPKWEGVPLAPFSQGIAVDTEVSVAYVMNGGHDNIVAADLATGHRLEVASGVTRSRSCSAACTVANEHTKGFAYDAEKKLLYVSGGGLVGDHALFVIDPESGDKVVISR